MIQKTIVAITLLSGILCMAQSINFEPDLATAFDKAKQQNKIVFVEYYNINCPVCKTLEPMFKDPDIRAFYNRNFISYKLDTDQIKKEDSLFIAQTKLKMESVPFFLFFDADKKFMHHSGAKPDPNYIIGIGKAALDPEQRTGNLSNKYNSGDRSIKTLYAYSNLLQLYKKDSLVNSIANDLFDAFPKQNLGSKTSYIITKNSVFSIENGFFDYWVHHINQLKGFETGKKEGSEIQVLENILSKSINSEAKKNWSLEKIKSVKEMMLKTGLSDHPDTFFWQQESLLLVQENRENEAVELFRKMIENEGSNITSALYMIDYYLNILTMKSSLILIKACIDQLAIQDLSVSERADLYYTELLYYKKNAVKKEFLKQEQEAIKFYKKNKIDRSKLDLLLKH